MGDWFLFFMLGQNVDTLIFKEVMHELAKRLGHASKDFGKYYAKFYKICRYMYTPYLINLF